MSEYDEENLLEDLITVGTDADWADFWADEEPLEVLMNDTKLEKL